MNSKITCDKYIQEIIMDALKLYYKLGLVELEVLNDFEPLQNLIPEESRENFKESLKANKEFWGYSENTHIGIASSEVDEKVQTAARIYRAIKLHRFCLDNADSNSEAITEESLRFGKFDGLFDKQLDFSIITDGSFMINSLPPKVEYIPLTDLSDVIGINPYSEETPIEEVITETTTEENHDTDIQPII